MLWLYDWLTQRSQWDMSGGLKARNNTAGDFPSCQHQHPLTCMKMCESYSAQ